MDCMSEDCRLSTVSSAIYIPVAIICCVVIILISLLIAINIRFRNYKLLKMTSPNLNIVMLVGAMFLIVSVLLNGTNAFLSSKSSTESFHSVWRVNQSCVWFLCIGFSLFYAPVAVKTWRVHKIFTDAAVKGRVIKDDRLLCIVAGIVFLDLILMGLWFILDTPECNLILQDSAPGFYSTLIPIPKSVPESNTVSISPQVNNIETYISICSSAYTPVWVLVEVIYKTGLIFYVIFVSWSTRFVTFPSMKDSSGTIISSFVTLVMFCCGLPLLVSFARWPSVQFGIYAAVILVSTLTFIVLHYAPKVLLLRKHKKDEGMARGFSQYTTPQKKEYSDEEVRDLVVQNTSLRKEVQDKQRKYKLLLEQHRIAKAQLLKFTFGKEIENDNSTGDVIANEKTVEISTKNSEVNKTRSSPVLSASESSNTNQDKKDEAQIEPTVSTPVIPNGTKSPQTIVRQQEKVSTQLSSSSSPRRVSFHPQINECDEEDHGIEHYIQQNTVDSNGVSHGKTNHHANKKFIPSLGKRGWDYYTRGTGYLRYKENVLHHNINGNGFGTDKTDDNPNRIVARKNEEFKTSETIPMQQVQGNSSENKQSYDTKKSDFKYFSTSAASRSPSITSDKRNKNNNKADEEYISTGNEIPSECSTLSIKRKEKRPMTGNKDVTVKTCEPSEVLHQIEFDFTSGSDSDDYDNSTTSMDSITCELFSPLSYRHRHYLRHYDVMHAKYIAHREKQRKRQKKNAIYYLEKSEGYSSDAANNPTKRSETPHKLQISTNKRNSYLQHEPDERFIYDSITSSDSESSYSDVYWFNNKSADKKQAPKPRSSAKEAAVDSYKVHRPMPLSTARTKGIFV